MVLDVKSSALYSIEIEGNLQASLRIRPKDERAAGKYL